MKRIFVSAAAAALLTAGAFLSVSAWTGPAGTAWGQGGAAPAGPHKIGLIDMAEVFKKYKKFERLREGLKQEIEQSDAEAKQMAGRIQTLGGKLKQLTDGSPEYTKMEQEIIGLTSELEGFRKGKQREFLRKESQIYKTIYLEVTDAVKKYSSFYKYTLIVRFNRQSLEEAENPGDVIQRMNQLVVDYRSEDDITDSVLDYLNKKDDIAMKGGPRRTN